MIQRPDIINEIEVELQDEDPEIEIRTAEARVILAYILELERALQQNANMQDT